MSCYDSCVSITPLYKMADYTTPKNLPAPLTIDDFDVGTDTPINLKSQDCMLVLFLRKGDRKSMAYYQAFRRASMDSGPKFRYMDFSEEQNTELLNLLSNQAQYNTTGSAFAYGAVRTPTILAYQRGKPVGFFNTRHTNRRGSEFSSQDIITYANNLACRADYYEPFQQERTTRINNNVSVVNPRSKTVRSKAYFRPYSSQLNKGTPVGLTDSQIRTIEQGGPGPTTSDRAILSPTELSRTGDLPIGSGTETSPTSVQIQSEVIREQQELAGRTPVIYSSPSSPVQQIPMGDALSPTSIQRSTPPLSAVSQSVPYSMSVPQQGYLSPSGGYLSPGGSYLSPSGSYQSPGGSLSPSGSYQSPGGSYLSPSGSYQSPGGSLSPSGSYQSPGGIYQSPGDIYQSPALASGYQVTDIGSVPSVYSTPTAYNYPYPGQTPLTQSYQASPPSYSVIRSVPNQQTGYISIPASTNPYR